MDRIKDTKEVRGRRKKDHAHTEHETHLAHDESNWLVSYADMMTLLFGFFVLMYTFSRIDEKKFEVVRKDVARYFGGQVKQNPTLTKIEAEVKDQLVQMGLDKNVELIARDSEIELRFKGSLHFLPGTAQLTKESRFVLEKLIERMKQDIKADSITVEGHTDGAPIQSLMYPSNWELSTARASAIVREFEAFGFDGSKMTAQGFGSTRPLAPNQDEKGNWIKDNQEMNRRVLVSIGFKQNMDDAIHATRNADFVNADEPESRKQDGNPLYQENGKLTWKQQLEREIESAESKIRVGEERLRVATEREAVTRRLNELQSRLNEIEKKIETTETETVKLQGRGAKRAPASGKKLRGSGSSSTNGSTPSASGRGGTGRNTRGRTAGGATNGGAPLPNSVPGAPVTVTVPDGAGDPAVNPATLPAN